MPKKMIALLLCCLFTISSAHFFAVFADDGIENEEVSAELFKVQPAMAASKLPFIDATAAIVMDMKSGRVLYEKNSKSRKAIASTTKIMTGIIAIENGNLNDMVKISKRAASVGGSTIDVKEGQQYTLKELLYGLLLNSGNDAAIAIAEHIGGSVDGFVEMMNAKAQELGAMETNFKSPHGLDIDGHYSTAYDLALITRYALQNQTFSEIVRTTKASIPAKQLYNTNEMLGLYPGADGVKTGFTGQAGRCLVTSATRDNWRIISVVLGCPTRTKRAQSSKSILDYGFANYKPYTILTQGEVIDNLPVIKGKQDSVPVRVAVGAEMPLKEDEISSMKRVVELPDNLETPVAEGQVVGKIKYLVKDQVIAESDLKTGFGVEKKGVKDYLGEVLIEWQRIMKEGLQP